MSLLHSFFYPETIKAFKKVIAIDPDCAMAYWGVAMSQRPNPLVRPFLPAALAAGEQAILQGLALAPPTQRERDWLAAAEPFFKDAGSRDQQTRSTLYEQAMERLYRRYPQDTEAAVFYALALNENADPADKTYRKQRQAATILERVRKLEPDHPGVLHYLIHSYDYPELASRGVSAADRYAGVAAGAPHALHMPSHTYTILGLWPKSIASNLAALAAARRYAAQHNSPGVADPTEPHFLDFLETDYLQLGEDRQARRVRDEAASLQRFSSVRPTVDSGLAAIPARYVLERGAWAEAARLETRPSQFPYARAITAFARALGAAQTGDVAAAGADIVQLRAARDADQVVPGQQY